MTLYISVVFAKAFLYYSIIYLKRECSYLSIILVNISFISIVISCIYFNYIPTFYKFYIDFPLIN